MNRPGQQTDFDTNRCQCCQWYIDCRGTCEGTSDDRPCTNFVLATNRNGDVNAETGDVIYRMEERIL